MDSRLEKMVSSATKMLKKTNSSSKNSNRELFHVRSVTSTPMEFLLGLKISALSNMFHPLLPNISASPEQERAWVPRLSHKVVQ